MVGLVEVDFQCVDDLAVHFQDCNRVNGGAHDVDFEVQVRTGHDRFGAQQCTDFAFVEGVDLDHAVAGCAHCAQLDLVVAGLLFYEVGDVAVGGCHGYGCCDGECCCLEHGFPFSTHILAGRLI